MFLRFLVFFILGGTTLVSQAEVRDELKDKFAAGLLILDKDAKRPVQTARRGERVVGAIKLVGCSSNAMGKCDAEADYRVYVPDGSLSSHIEHAELWKDKAPAPGEVVTGTVLGITTSLTDPVGKYRIEATVRDLVSGQSIELSQAFTIIK